MPPGGRLTIETRNTQVDETYVGGRPNLVPGWYAGLKVSDTGTGMTQEVIDRAFEPFFTTKPKGQGTGLGLATTYRIIAQAGGALREVTRRLLSRNGYRVLAAVGGQAALSLLVSHRGLIDVLLTDVVMPKMQGREVAERVRALQPGARVLYMSGYTADLLGEQGALGPGVQLIEKPFTERGLLVKMSEILSTPPP